MTTNGIASDYTGITQEEASKALGKVRTTIVRKLESIGSHSHDIGVLLLDVRESGLAVAALSDIDSAERDWSPDGRQTAMSSFRAECGLAKTVGDNLVRWALRTRQLSENGVDAGKTVESTFRDIPADLPEAEFVALVESIIADDDVTRITANVVKDAARNTLRESGDKAGDAILPPARGSSNDDADPLQDALNRALVAMKKADSITDAHALTITAIAERMLELQAVPVAA